MRRGEKSLSNLGELALISWIRKKAGIPGKGLVLGIGDDAAAFAPGKACKEKFLYTSDMMLEGVHFDLRYTTAYQLGFKLVSVNASDIYAMGGAPRYALMELAAPPGGTGASFIRRLFEGVFDALRLYGMELAGGDVSASKAGLVLGMSVIGRARRIIRRSGARVGDGVYVTGPLGEAACGLKLLQRIKKPVEIERGRKWLKGPLSWPVMEPLLKRHLMPVAKKPPAAATAMIDISDGLFLDLWRLCKESGVGVRIYEGLIPISGQMKEAARKLVLSPLELAAKGGEDYELLFTAPMGGKHAGIRIGEITKAGCRIASPAGRLKKFGAEGYTHFAD